MSKPKLNINVGGLHLKNPVLTAAGPVGFGSSFADFFPLDILGGLVTRSLTYEPRLGNEPPRLCETPSGVMHNVGFQNPGLKLFKNKFYPNLAKLDTNLIISIYGDKIEEYKAIASELNSLSKVNALEVNMYLDYEQYKQLNRKEYLQRVKQIINEVKQVTHLPLWVKLMPYTGCIEETARLAESEGADAITVANSFRSMALDAETQASCLGSGTGGLSGAAIKPIALFHVWEASKAVNIPVIGVGGILSSSDAVEFILAGASAVEIGSGSFTDPNTVPRVIGGIEDYLARHKIMDIRNLVGAAKI